MKFAAADGNLKFSCVNSCGFSGALRAAGRPSLRHYYVSRRTHATNITAVSACARFARVLRACARVQDHPPKSSGDFLLSMDLFGEM